MYNAVWKHRRIPTQTKDMSWGRGDEGDGQAGSVGVLWKGFQEKLDGALPSINCFPCSSPTSVVREFALWPGKKFRGLEVYL